MKYLTFLLAFFVVSSFAQSAGELENYEKEIETMIQEAKKNPEEKYNIYSLFGRELLGLKKFSLARKYYEKAVAQPTGKEVDKSEAYYNLLYIAYRQGSETGELKSLLGNVKEELKKHATSPGEEAALAHWEEIINNKGKGKLNENLLNSFYGAHYAQNKVEEFVKAKKYREALQLMPLSLEEANIVQQVEKDILTKIVFPENKNYLCEEKFKKYPNSITYTMLICRYLLDKKSVPLERIEKQIAKESAKKLYWVDALAEVK